MRLRWTEGRRHESIQKEKVHIVEFKLIFFIQIITFMKYSYANMKCLKIISVYCFLTAPKRFGS